MPSFEITTPFVFVSLVIFLYGIRRLDAPPFTNMIDCRPEFHLKAPLKTIPLRALVAILLKPPANFQLHLKI